MECISCMKTCYHDDNTDKILVNKKNTRWPSIVKRSFKSQLSNTYLSLDLLHDCQCSVFSTGQVTMDMLSVDDVTSCDGADTYSETPVVIQEFVKVSSTQSFSCRLPQLNAESSSVSPHYIQVKPHCPQPKSSKTKPTKLIAYKLKNLGKMLKERIC